MTHKQDRAAFLRQPAHLSQAFFLKFNVANRQHFIEQKYFRIQVSRHSKSQAHKHTA